MKGLKPAVLMILALTPLAVLQYHWVGVVSKAERDRMRRGLETDTARFAKVFDRTLFELILHFQSGEPGPREDFPAYLLEKVRQWRSSAQHPDLIEEIYMLERGRETSRTTRYNDGSELFETCEPPEIFKQLFGTRGRSGPGPYRIRRGSPFFLDGSIPAVVMPAVSLGLRRGRRGGRISRASFRGDRVVIKLDLNYIQQELIPDLVETYFYSRDVGHVVRVLGEGKPRPLLFQTAATFSQEPDLRAEIFRLPDFPDFLDQVRKLAELPESPPLPVPNEDPSEKPSRIAAGPEGQGAWLVEVSHRSGSLEAHVARSRAVNLTLNFGILAILGVGIWLLVISNQRSRRLAKQQLEFVAGVSHEILTPLAAIRSAAQNLTDGVVNQPDKIRNYGAMILKEGTRLSDMVEKVLDFAGMQARQKRYEFQILDFKELIRESIEECRPMLEEASFEATVTLPEDRLIVRADRDALKQTIHNLVANVVKYGREDPRLWLRVTRQKDGLVLLETEDRGPGVPQNERPHLFEPFFRGKTARDSQIKGSGLGLCLVQNIVTAHGGKVGIASASPHGAIFKIWLPVSEHEQAAAQTDR